MEIISPIVLAGGYGNRLWPLSRKSYPKQFSSLVGKNTLFQQTALRLVSSDIARFGQQITLTNSDFRFIVLEQMQNVGIEPGPILIEPEAKNTAPAVLAATIFSLKKNKDAILLVAPSDHIIEDTERFHKAIEVGLSEIKKGNIVTFGVQPTHPETGYGYLQLDGKITDSVSSLTKFVEKPDDKTAQYMCDSGIHLWNAGIFLFRASDMLKAFKEHEIDLVKNVKLAVDNSVPDLNFLRLEKNSWKTCKSNSLDYAIMEKVTNLSVVPFSGGWSDLGSWEAVWEKMEPNEDGVSISSNVHSINCNNSLIRSETSSQQVVGLGLENVIVVAMPDAVLVADKQKSQDVKHVVESLKLKGVTQAEIFPKDHRPWGWFESLAISERFQVKRICVNPGAALSLQSHHHRSEHWIVVEGTAKVTVDDEVKLVAEGQSVYIPLGSVHRMENPGKFPMLLIEVQTGAYLGEDDIVRYEDVYSRS